MRVELHDIGHRFGESPWLFRRAEIDLHPGQSYALTGPSGSGKSTLLGIIAGWITPAEGTVHHHHVPKTLWVFQSPHGVASRSVEDHVILPLLSRGLSLGEAQLAAATLLERFGLGQRAQHPFSALSGGEGQRLMLARALAVQPGLLLVDEPTAQLDLATARNVAESIKELAGEQTIVVVATHDLHTQQACTDHIDLGKFSTVSASGGIS